MTTLHHQQAKFCGSVEFVHFENFSLVSCDCALGCVMDLPILHGRVHIYFGGAEGKHLSHLPLFDVLLIFYFKKHILSGSHLTAALMMNCRRRSFPTIGDAVVQLILHEIFYYLQYVDEAVERDYRQDVNLSATGTLSDAC